MQAQEDNGWVPIIDGKVNFPDDKGSTDIHVNGANVISHLKMTFQGSLDLKSLIWTVAGWQRAGLA